MNDSTSPQIAPYSIKYFPQHVALLTVGENMMPIGHWTVISKTPFRFLIAMEQGNHSLVLLKKYHEAALHFMPWSDRQRVARAGYISGRDGDKADRLGYELIPSQKLQHTKLVEGADSVFETVVNQELKNLSREFAIYVLDVVASQGNLDPMERKPILYLSDKDFATYGERWKYQR